MTNETTAEFIQTRSLRTAQVYGAAGLCLAVGLAVGYVAHGPQSATLAARTIVAPAAGPAVIPGSLPGAVQPTRMPANPAQTGVVGTNPHALGGLRLPTLEQMKQMADKQAAPLKGKLNTDPKNSADLMQLGAIYHSTHQFVLAAVYYGRAAQADPKNVVVRTKLASSLYRSGDVDGAIVQLNHALSIDPKDANALFDLGVIRMEGKQDGKGALAAWQRLLKTNPQMSSERRAEVQKLMASVMNTLNPQQATEGAHP